MESEKVKEIKELFKNCDFTLKHCGNCVLWKDEDCIETIKSKVLTLINELESENERLKEDNRILSDNDTLLEMVALLSKEKDILLNKIAELEKEIKGNVFYAKGYAEGIKNTYEVVMPNKLKQFAERLKEKLEENSPIAGYDLEDLEFDGETIQECIDETLKEFLKGENNE